MAITKVPGLLDSEEDNGNNLVDQAVKAALKSIKIKVLIANINYFPTKDLKLIFKDAQSRPLHKVLYWASNDKFQSTDQFMVWPK